MCCFLIDSESVLGYTEIPPVSSTIWRTFWCLGLERNRKTKPGAFLNWFPFKRPVDEMGYPFLVKTDPLVPKMTWIPSTIPRCSDVAFSFGCLVCRNQVILWLPWGFIASRRIDWKRNSNIKKTNLYIYIYMYVCIYIYIYIHMYIYIDIHTYEQIHFWLLPSRPHARHAHRPRVAGRRTMHLTIGLHTVRSQKVKMNGSNSGSIWVWVNTYSHPFLLWVIHIQLLTQLWLGVNKRYQGFDPSPYGLTMNWINNGFSVGRSNARRVLGLGCKNTRETNMVASSSIISAIPKWFWMVVSTCAN